MPVSACSWRETGARIKQHNLPSPAALPIKQWYASECLAVGERPVSTAEGITYLSRSTGAAGLSRSRNVFIGTNPQSAFVERLGSASGYVTYRSRR
jgi:hypothetical protein